MKKEKIKRGLIRTGKEGKGTKDGAKSKIFGQK